MKNSSITSGQKDRISAMVVDRLIALGVDNPSAQRFIGNGDLLAERMDPIVLDLAGMRYRDEEVETSYSYPAGYNPKPICNQLVLLGRDFSGLDPEPVLKAAASFQARPLPPGADLTAVIPYYLKVAKSYGEATELVMDLLAKRDKNFKCWLAGKLGQKYMRLVAHTEYAWTKIYQIQKTDYLVLPVQFGFLHRGQSTRRAREVFLKNEFGLGPYEVGVMLLTHPERLSGDPNELYIDCPGAEYSSRADGGFTRASCFLWCRGGLSFFARWVVHARADYGSASGFLLQ